jgi:hypothetical protein
VWVSALYCAPRQGTTRQPQRRAGLYPELATFGFHDGQSAALQSRVARRVALLPSFGLARSELAQDGVKLDVKTVHSTTHRLGQQFLQTRRHDLERYRAGLMPAGGQLAGKRVVAEVDGGRIRLRKVTRKQRGKGKNKQQQRRYRGSWREPKLLTIFEIDDKGKKVERGCVRIDGTFRGPDEVMELLAMRLHQLGASQASVLVFVADGAPWIWERLGWVVKRLGLDQSRVACALDWCHALHHVGLALAAVGLEASEHRRVFKKLRKWLKKGEAAVVLNELERLGKGSGCLEAMRVPVAYLDKHLEAGHLDYDAMAERGLPIGSGAIESTIRRVVNLRLKGNGLMWLEENAEGMILLRAAALTGRWDEEVLRAHQCQDQCDPIDWKWTSPDMPFQLKAQIDISPPVPQRQAG